MGSPTHNHGAAELLRHPVMPTKLLQGTQTWNININIKSGMRKSDVPMDCPSPGHQLASPGEGRSTHRGLQEAAFQNDSYYPLWREIPPCIQVFSQHPAFFILHQVKLPHFQTIFAAVQLLTLKLQVSLSLTQPDLTSKQAASLILPESSLRTNQGKQRASSGTSLSLLISQNTGCNFLFTAFILWLCQPSHWTYTTTAVHRCQKLIPCCPEYFAKADKKLSNPITRPQLTHKRYSQNWETMFLRIFLLESLKQLPGTVNRISVSINGSSYLFIF